MKLEVFGESIETLSEKLRFEQVVNGLSSSDA